MVRRSVSKPEEPRVSSFTSCPSPLVALGKHQQAAVGVFDVELAHAVGLVEGRPNTAVRQFRELGREFLVKLVEAVHPDVQRDVVGGRRQGPRIVAAQEV